MPDSDEKLREELIRTLREGSSSIPTSAIGRLSRTAGTMLSAGRFIRSRRKKDHSQEEIPLNLEKIGAIVSSFGRMKGIAMKMGQMMSYIDIDIPEELRAALSVLQTHAQPMDFAQVREIISTDLPDKAPDLLAGMKPVPLAAASIGQVHRAELPDGTPVAVKVQYPEIEYAIRSDFRPTAIGTTIASLIYPGARVDAFIREARTRFLEECDYRHEAESQDRFIQLFRNHPLIMIPQVHFPYCSHRVFTSTLVEGAHFEEYLERNPPPEDRDRIGAALFEFYVGTLFRHNLYNCDPHPGNYLFLPDGRIAILDYGCTRLFPPEFVAKLAALTRAVHLDDRGALHQSFLDLGMVRENRRYDFNTARLLVRSFYGPMLKDEIQRVELGQVHDVRSIFQAKQKLLKLALPGEFLFLFRIRFGLLSILARLGARANWYQLEREYLSTPARLEKIRI